MATDVPMSDVLGLANVISDSRNGKEALAGINTALGDLAELLEELPGKNAKGIAEAFASAMKDALKALPTPTVTANVEAPKQWTTLTAKPKYDERGRVVEFEFTRT